jgi:hypothetical protein
MHGVRPRCVSIFEFEAAVKIAENFVAERTMI